MAARSKKVKEQKFNKDEVFEALNALSVQKGLSAQTLANSFAESLVVAARKEYGSSDNVKCIIDVENKIFDIYVEKLIVDEVYDPLLEITREDALLIDPTALDAEVIAVKVDPLKFGRIMAINSKNNFRQGVREAEKNKTLAEFKSVLHKNVVAEVSKVDSKSGNIVLRIGNYDATLPRSEQCPNDEFDVGDIIKVYVVDVKESEKGSFVMISRTHPNFIRRFFESEIPEIEEGIVSVKAVSRQPGTRTKIAVYSTDEKIDPVGACIGEHGARINGIVNELSGEKIDIVKYSDDPAEYVKEALLPANIASVEILSVEEKSCKALVPESQLSLAIGNHGLNVRLAAKLTGWRIDIHPESGFFGE